MPSSGGAKIADTLLLKVRQAFKSDMAHFFSKLQNYQPKQLTFKTFLGEWHASGLKNIHCLKGLQAVDIIHQHFSQTLETLLLSIGHPNHPVSTSILLVFLLYTLHGTQINLPYQPIKMCPSTSLPHRSSHQSSYVLNCVAIRFLETFDFNSR